MAKATEPTEAPRKKQFSRPWLPTNHMAAKPRPGMALRWLSKERLARPKEDRDGPGEWLPDPHRHEELRRKIDSGSKIGQLTEVPGMVLCEAPQEWLDERNAFYAAQCKTRKKQLDTDLSREVKSATDGRAKVHEVESFGDEKK